MTDGSRGSERERSTLDPDNGRSQSDERVEVSSGRAREEIAHLGDGLEHLRALIKRHPFDDVVVDSSHGEDSSDPT